MHLCAAIPDDMCLVDEYHSVCKLSETAIGMCGMIATDNTITAIISMSTLMLLALVSLLLLQKLLLPMR